MTLRDEFEKLCPEVNYVEFIGDKYVYRGRDELFIDLAERLNSKYEGFLLGRQNTVSVEKYQEVWNAYVEAKRRTEEV